MTRSTAVSTTRLLDVAMTSFVPRLPALSGVCMYLGLHVEAQSFVLRSHCPRFINAHVFLSLPTSLHLLLFSQNLTFGPHSLLSLRLSLASSKEGFVAVPCLPSSTLPLLLFFFSFQLMLSPQAYTAFFIFLLCCVFSENLNVMSWALVCGTEL